MFVVFLGVLVRTFTVITVGVNNGDMILPVLDRVALGIMFGKAFCSWLMIELRRTRHLFLS